jgi:hypothetical protein
VCFIDQATGDLTIIASFHRRYGELALAESNVAEKVTDRNCHLPNLRQLDE